MLFGLYTSAAGLRVNELKQAVGSNNLANAATVGFKLDAVTVEARPAPANRLGSGGSPNWLAGLCGGVVAGRTVTDLSAGPLEATGQPLDLAIDTGAVANGFLGLRGSDGRDYWTRDGRLAIAPTGELITQAGRWSVLDASGQPIRLDPQAGRVAIDSDGRIRQNNNEVARLKLASFDRPDLLTKRGVSRFQAPGDAGQTEFRGQVLQGHIEASAVETTSLLARLIETQRAYEANANMIRFQDQTLQRAVNDIGRLS